MNRAHILSVVIIVLVIALGIVSSFRAVERRHEQEFEYHKAYLTDCAQYEPVHICEWRFQSMMR